MVGGVGVAACGTGVGIPVGHVCLGAAGICALIGGGVGLAAGTPSKTITTPVTEIVNAYSPLEYWTVIVAGCLLISIGMFLFVRAIRAVQTKRLEFEDIKWSFRLLECRHSDMRDGLCRNRAIGDRRRCGWCDYRRYNCDNGCRMDWSTYCYDYHGGHGTGLGDSSCCRRRRCRSRFDRVQDLSPQKERNGGRNTTWAASLTLMLKLNLEIRKERRNV